MCEQGSACARIDVDIWAQTQLLEIGKRMFSLENTLENAFRRFDTDNSGEKKNESTTFKKPLRCFEFGKAFISTSKLKIHERIHTGEKPYEWEICAMKFTNNSALTTYTRIHTGEKPFICPF